MNSVNNIVFDFKNGKNKTVDNIDDYCTNKTIYLKEISVFNGNEKYFDLLLPKTKFSTIIENIQ